MACPPSLNRIRRAPGTAALLLVGLLPICPSMVLASNWVIHDVRNIPGKEAVAIVVDRFGNKWIGTHGGLAELTRMGDWKLYNRSNTGGYLRSDSITALALDANDNLWVGTRNGGLSVFGNGVWQNHTVASTHGGLPDDRISALSIASGKDIWVGTMSGFAKLSGNAWTTYSADKISNRLPNKAVSALAAEGKTDVWIGTIAGLVRFTGSNWSIYNKDNTNGVLPHNTITSISISPTGVKWIGTFHGLAVLAGMVWTPLSSSIPPEIRNAQVYRAYLDSQERGWLAFRGGAARCEKGDWTLFNKSNSGGGVPTIYVNVVMPDENGSIWFGTHEGLSQFAP